MNSVFRLVCAGLCIAVSGLVFLALAPREGPPVPAPQPAALIQFPRAPSEPSITLNPVFGLQLPMREWALFESDWIPNGQVWTGPPVLSERHRSPYPGDVTFQVEPRLTNADGFFIALKISADHRRNIDGYVFRYRSKSDSGGGSPDSRIELLRDGQVVASRYCFEMPLKLALRRSGNYIIAWVNGQALLTFRDPAPLSGWDLSYLATGAEIPRETIRIDSPNVRTDYFSSAPTEWRSAGSAIAEISNRSQEDPRWTYFTLGNNRRAGNNAVLWNKRTYAGDVCIEFYFGTRMMGERGQPYTYARDVAPSAYVPMPRT